MSERLGAIDGLRALAIALVVWFHVWQISWLPPVVHLAGRTLDFDPIPRTGFVGVDLFFFLSGFCLYLPYAESLVDGKRLRSAADFYYRRALKILPSYWAAIALMLALGIGGIGSLSDGVRQVALHLLFIHTWFADSYGSINGVLWSLGVEVEFYLIFPLLRPIFDRRPLGTFGVLAALALGYRFATSHDPSTFVYRINQLPATIDLFAAGMLVAYLTRALPAHAPRLAKRAALWTLVAIGGAALFGHAMVACLSTANAPNWPNAWYVLGRDELLLAFAALGLGSLFAARWWQALLANPPLRFLALVSYNVYLWHAAVAHVLLAHRIPFYGGDPHGDPHWQVAYTVVACAAALAVGSFFTFALERPLLRMRPGYARLVGRSRTAGPEKLTVAPS
ncbi:MAG: acyltransferase family protein [Vulcanimicrobiaceae bacterium]